MCMTLLDKNCLYTCENKQKHAVLFGITTYNDTETHDAMKDAKQLKDITSIEGSNQSEEAHCIQG